MKLENFKIRAPSFAIHKNGTFSLADLDDDDFDTYQNEYGWVIKRRREELIKQNNEDALHENDGVDKE